MELSELEVEVYSGVPVVLAVDPSSLHLNRLRNAFEPRYDFYPVSGSSTKSSRSIS
jgi:hypothetical protein